MQTSTSTVIGYILLIIIIAAGAWYFFAHPSSGVPAASQTDTDRSEAASAAVVQFGRQLQRVSLLAPDATSTMAAAYGPYVTPALLSVWQASTSTAPGKVVSSPWPDHIEIASAVQQADRSYLVTGDIVLMTSAGNAGTVPFTATVADTSGIWLITDFTQSP